jgi:hypothetical protein
MTSNRKMWSILGVAAVMAVPALSDAQTIRLNRDTVIPVVFEKDLSLRHSRAGDRFEARVDETRDLPRGTRFEGRVRTVRDQRGNEPGYMDLEFTSLVMPDGRRQNIQATPIPWNDRNVRRDRDGRFTASQNVRRKEGQVIGGAIGGLIIGSLIKKPLEGTVIGTVAGILMAENDRGNDGHTIARAGQRMGAVIDREVSFNWNGRWDAYDNRNDRRDDRDDDRWNDRRDDRWDDRYDDRRWDDRFDGNVRITYGNREMRFDRNQQPYRAGGTVMVPLESAANQLGLRVSRERDRVIFVDGADGYLEFERNSREARLNGRRFTMPQAVTERDRTIYVPIDILAQISRETVSVDGTRISRRNL